VSAREFGVTDQAQPCPNLRLLIIRLPAPMRRVPQPAMPHIPMDGGLAAASTRD